MSETACIIVPWAGGCPHREAAWAWVRRRLEASFITPILVGELEADEPWSKGRAVARAIDQLDDVPDVLVIWDADVWVEPSAVARAAAVVGSRRARANWAVPHRTVRRLDEPTTGRVLAGEALPPANPGYDRLPYVGQAAGGIVVIRSELYLTAPFDPRFEGWGHEDQSAAWAWTELSGEPWRGHVDLWHLWHPPQPRLTVAVGSRESYELRSRYRQAIHDEATMRLIATEARELTWPADVVRTSPTSTSL